MQVSVGVGLPREESAEDRFQSLSLSRGDTTAANIRSWRNEMKSLVGLRETEAGRGRGGGVVMPRGITTTNSGNEICTDTK